MNVSCSVCKMAYKGLRIRDLDGTDYILVHDERYACDVKFTDEQWQLLTDVAKKCD